MKSINMEGDFFCGGWNFSKPVSVDPTFIREMRVNGHQHDIDNALKLSKIRSKFLLPAFKVNEKVGNQQN